MLQTGTGNIAARNKVSIYSETGEMRGVSLLSTSITDNTGEVVVRTAGDIGSESQALRVNTDKLAARSTDGSVYLQAEGGDITVASLNSTNCYGDPTETVDGILSGADEKIWLNVTEGSLTLEERVGSDVEGERSAVVALRANDEIDLGDMKVVATEKISIESVTEGLAGLPTTGPALQTTDPDSAIVVKTQEAINLTIDTDQLAAESTHGGVTIKTTGDRDLEVVELELEIPTTEQTVTGVKAGTDDVVSQRFI
ncbi:MAG: hypothetical protein WC314_21620 [Vulcanimicrobiota bacterium]